MRKWAVDESEDDAFGGATASEVPVNAYLEDPLQALDLLARVVGQVRQAGAPASCQVGQPVAELRKAWEALFSKLSIVELPGQMGFRRRAMACCDRIRDRTLAATVGGKVVLGVGGRFSSGKSAFINSVVGLGALLPEDGRPTTSIPTYVTKGPERRYWLTAQHGHVSREIDATVLEVLSHDFDVRYHIGFSPFIDSCVITTPDFAISPRIVLLDTPGYSNAEDADRTFSLTDKEMSLKLLRMSDRLIWVIQQENGTISEEDLRFLGDVGHDRPVLIVVTHADQVGVSSMREVVGHIAEMTKGLECGVFGITGYSSPDGREFDGGHLIRDFLADVVSEGTGKNDVVRQFEILENEILAALDEMERDLRVRTAELRRYIAGTKKVNAMHSLAMLMSSSSVRLKNVRSLLKTWPDECERRRNLVRTLAGGKNGRN